MGEPGVLFPLSEVGSTVGASSLPQGETADEPKGEQDDGQEDAQEGERVLQDPDPAETGGARSGALMNGISALYKKRHEREDYPLCLVRRTAICKLGSGFSPEGPCWYPDLRLPASTTVRSNACCLSHKPVAVDDSNLNSQHPRQASLTLS